MKRYKADSIGVISRWVGAALLTAVLTQPVLGQDLDGTPHEEDGVPCLLGGSPAGRQWVYESQNQDKVVGARGLTLRVEEVGGMVGGYPVYRVTGKETGPGDDGSAGSVYIHCSVGGGTALVGLHEGGSHSLNEFRGSYDDLALFTPPLSMCDYGAPLGTQCDWSGLYDDPDSDEDPKDDFAFHVKTQVVAYEDVSVPAGTYQNAMKMSLVCMGVEDQCEEISSLYVWVDPDAGVVMLEITENGTVGALELVAVDTLSLQAAFTYEARDEFVVSEFNSDDGALLVGRAVTIDASPSFDPDGKIDLMFFTVNGPYADRLRGPLVPDENEVWEFVFPREDYSVTLEVRDDDGQWDEQTQPIQIRLPECLYEGSSESGGALMWSPPFFGGSTIDLFRLYYIHNGEYHVLPNLTAAGPPQAEEYVYYLESLHRHLIAPATPEALPSGVEVVGRIKYDLSVYPPSVVEATGFGVCMQRFYEDRVRQAAGGQQSRIYSDDPQLIGANVVSPDTDALFTLAWPGGDLSFSLISPGGVRVDSIVASSDPNVRFDAGRSFARYLVSDPEPGRWWMEVGAEEVSAEGEAYVASLLVNSTLVLTPSPDTSFVTGEGSLIQASIYVGGQPLPGADIFVDMRHPDGGGSGFYLNDRGRAGDAVALDGIYSYRYTFEEPGTYDVSFHVAMQLGEESFERTAFARYEVGARVSAEFSELREQIVLSPNYPNPFHSFTTIGFSVPVSGHVTLDVYDVVGRRVQTLIAGPLTAGSYEVVFEAPQLSSGVYFYRLQSGGRTEIRTLTLTK